jgi:hypothetical protein
MARTASLVLWLISLTFLGFGLAFLLNPSGMTEGLDIALPTLRAEIEIRAFYGGLEIGFAVFLALAAGRPTWRQPALVATTLVLGGTAATRVVGQLLGGYFPMHAAYAALELSGAALSAWVASRLNR